MAIFHRLLSGKSISLLFSTFVFLPAGMTLKHRLFTPADQIQQHLSSSAVHLTGSPTSPLPASPTHTGSAVHSSPSHHSAAAAHLSPSWCSCASRGKPARPQTAFWPAPATSLWGSSCRWAGGTSGPRRRTSEGSSDSGHAHTKKQSDVELASLWVSAPTWWKIKSLLRIKEVPHLHHQMQRRPRLFTQHPELHTLCEEQHTHAHTHQSEAAVVLNVQRSRETAEVPASR